MATGSHVDTQHQLLTSLMIEMGANLSGQPQKSSQNRGGLAAVETAD